MLTYPSCPKKPKTKKRNSRPKRHRKIGIESPKGHEHRQLQFNLIYISDSFITISYVHAPNTVKRYSELRKTISMSHRAPQLYWVLPAAHILYIIYIYCLYIHIYLLSKRTFNFNLYTPKTPKESNKKTLGMTKQTPRNSRFSRHLGPGFFGSTTSSWRRNLAWMVSRWPDLQSSLKPLDFGGLFVIEKSQWG